VSARAREILEFLGQESESLLAELRDEGLFEADELSPPEADELRLAALLIRELGVNPAGVDVALHLRRRMLCLEDRMRTVLLRLLTELDER
jgi:hypothetical protein